MDKYTIIMTVIAVGAFFQRALREDVKWFPTLHAPYRAIVVAVLQFVATPVLDASITGAGVLAALVTGLLAVIPTLMNLIASLTKSSPVGASAVVLLLLVLSSSQAGCGAQPFICPVIDLAATICPILIPGPDGGKVAVSGPDLARVAVEHRSELRPYDGGAR